MCFTQEASAINALEMGPFSERECLIGVSTNGSIFVWSLTDGQCQFSKANSTYRIEHPLRNAFPSDTDPIHDHWTLRTRFYFFRNSGIFNPDISNATSLQVLSHHPQAVT